MPGPRSVLITGASSGFGRLTALTLARSGHTVFATMRDINGRNASSAAELRQIAASEGLKLHTLELDVTDAASVEKAVADAVGIAGRIDALVNNAGVLAVGLAEGFTDDQMASIFDANVFGPQRVARAVLPHMRRQGDGVIVWISSVMARFTIPYAAVYSASKAAVESLAENYRYDLAPLGIDSVLVEPGAHGTSVFHNAVYPADQARLAAYGPIADAPGQLFGAFAPMLQGPNAPQPQDVADAVVRLIEAPHGSRPLRTVVDRLPTGQGAEAVNATSKGVQAQILGSVGMGGFADGPSQK